MANELTTEKQPAKQWPTIEYLPFAKEDKNAQVTLTVAIVQSLLCVPTKQGAVCSAGQAWKFAKMCQAKGLDPYEGDAFLVGYDTKHGPMFSQITAHQAFLKRAELHPEYNGMRSGVVVIDKSTKDVIEREGDMTLDSDILYGAWATVYFKTRAVPMYKRLKLTTFAQTYGRWMADPAGMIVKCAEADALRSAFPTMLGGLYCGSEMGMPESQREAATAGYEPQTRIVHQGGARRSIANDKLADDAAKRKQPPPPPEEPEPKEPPPRDEADYIPEDAPPAPPPDDEEPPGEPGQMAAEEPAEQPWSGRLVADLSRDDLGPTLQDALTGRGITTWGHLVDILNYKTVNGETSSKLMSPTEVRKAKSVFMKAFKAGGFTGEPLK